MIQKIVSYIAAFYLYLVGKTSFVETADDPEFKTLWRGKKPLIYALWHNNQVFLAYAHRKEQVQIMVSLSKDGEYIAQVMNRMGLTPVRGSSSKGGEQALRQIIECLEKGGQAGFTPDGPKGPVQSVQAGIIWAAQKTGVPIVAISHSSRRNILFNSWDKFKVPLPFNHFVLVHGKPFTLPADMEMEEAKKKVRAALNETQNQADAYLRTAPTWWFLIAGQILFILYNFLSLLFSPIILLIVFIKFGLARSLKGLRERFGFNPFSVTEKPRLWFHAASVGEWRALKPLLKEVIKKSGFDIVVTVTTPEAKKLIEKEAAKISVRYLPVDYLWILRNWVKKLNPLAFFIVETELWPNLINVVHGRSVPIFILNGRLSEKSVRGWRKGRALVRQILAQVSYIFARTEKDKARFVRLGFPGERVLVLGNTKADNVVVVSSEEKEIQRNRFFKEWRGVCFMGVSTWPGEEELILKVFKKLSAQALRLILVPRRQERLREVSQLIQTHSLSFELFSEIKKGKNWESPVLLVDTVGDLKDLFIICDLAFIGGSIYPRGGQNPLEPGAARAALLFGPHMENFEEEAAGFLSADGGRQGINEEEVSRILEETILNNALRRELAENAAKEVLCLQGASNRTLEELSRQLGI